MAEGVVPLPLPARKNEAWQGPRLRARQLEGEKEQLKFNNLKRAGSLPRRQPERQPWGLAGLDRGEPYAPRKSDRRGPYARQVRKENPSMEDSLRGGRRFRGRPPRRYPPGLGERNLAGKTRCGLPSRRLYRYSKKRRRRAPRDHVLRERVRRQQHNWQAMSASKLVLRWIREGTRLSRE